MSSEWPAFFLEDCLDALIDYRGKTPQKTTSGIPLITAKIIKNGRIETPTEFIALENYDAWMRRGIPEPGDVVLTVEAPLGEVAQLGAEKVALAQRVVTLRGKKDLLNSSYLLYWLQSEEAHEKLTARASGTTVIGIKQRELRKVEIKLPPYVFQLEAVSILKAFDDRITLLRETNKTLESIAQAIFKSWFVDFDPVRAKMEGRQPEGMDEETAALFPDSFEESELGLIPRGWEVSKVGFIADVVDCLHAKKPTLIDTGKPFLQLNNIQDDGLLDTSQLARVSEQDYKKWIFRIEVSVGDCVITNVGRVGAVSQIPEGFKAAMGRNMTAIRLKSQYAYPTYLIELMQSAWMKAEIVRKTDVGTILNALNVKSIPELRCMLANEEVMAMFELIARPIRASMEKNLKRIRTLTTLRDTLLPRLLSGRLRLPEAQEITEAALS